MTKRLNIKHKNKGINPSTCTLGSAKILRPLKFIKDKCAAYLEPYPTARILASSGLGAAVNKLARQVE